MPKRSQEKDGEVGNEKKKRRIARTDDNDDASDKLFNLLSVENTTSAGLVYLWNQLTEHDNNQLRTTYLKAHPDCRHIMTVLELSTNMQDQDNVLLCLLLLEDILLFAAKNVEDNSNFNGVGSRLVTVILDAHLSSIVYSLSHNKPDILVAAAVRVLTAVVMQGLTCAVELLNKFDFESNHFDSLPRRHKTFKDQMDSVRSCFIKFAVSFFVVCSSSVITRVISFKKLVPSIFRNLSKDQPDIRVLFLSTLHDKVLLDPRIAKKAKLIVFNSYNLKGLIGLMCTNSCQDEATKLVVYNILHCLSSDLTCGICFKSVNIFDDIKKTNNKALLYLASNLSNYLDQSYPRGLIVSMISTCPDLLLPFLNGVSLDLNPQPTLKWISHVELVISLLSECFEVDKFMCSVDEEPNYVQSFVQYCCPQILHSDVINCGLRSTCFLIKDLCLKLLLAVLTRTEKLQEYLHGNIRVMFCDSVLSFLPDIKNILTLRHSILQFCTGKAPSYDGISAGDEPIVMARNEEVSGSDMLNNVMKVLYLYQKLVPTVLAQANVNISKLLKENIMIYDDRCGEKESSFIKTTLDILTDIPVGSLHNVLKGDFINCLLHLVIKECYQDKVMLIFIKCLRIISCLVDFEFQLSIICNVMFHHLPSSLYDETERGSLKDVIISAVNDISKQSYKFFDSTNDFVNWPESLCPFLASIIKQCNRSPTEPGMLMMSEVILKLVDTSLDPVNVSKCVLMKLLGDNESSLLHNKGENSIKDCSILLKDYLKSLTGKTPQTLELTHDILKANEFKGIQSPRELRYLLINRLMSNNVDLLSLLSDETSRQPTIDLLEAVSIPIILPSSPSHPLCDGKTLPCSLIWQSILRGHKTIHEVVNYLYREYKTYKSDVQSSVIVSSFTGGVDGSMSEYDLMVLARYVLSVFNCVLLHKNVVKASFICLELLSIIMKNCSEKLLKFILSSFQYLPVANSEDYTRDNSILSQLVSFCIYFKHPSIDKILFDYLASSIAVNKLPSDYLPQNALSLLNLLRTASTNNSYQHDDYLFKHLLHIIKSPHQQDHLLSFDLCSSLLGYCSNEYHSITDDLLIRILKSQPFHFCLKYVIQILQVTHFDDYQYVKILRLVKFVLERWKHEQGVHGEFDEEELSVFVKYGYSWFKKVVMEECDKNSLSDLCIDIVDLFIQLYPSIRKKFRKVLCFILQKYDRGLQEMTDFDIVIMGRLSITAVPHKMQMWSSVVCTFLTRLYKKLKTNSQKSPEMLLIEALRNTLSHGKCDNGNLAAVDGIVKIWNKFVLKAFKNRIDCHQVIFLCAELFAILYSNERTSDVDLISAEMIYSKLWHKVDNNILSDGHVELLLTLMDNITDASVYSNNHLIILLGNYTATLSLKDTGILSILMQYEKSGISLSSFFPLVWGSKAFEMTNGHDVSSQWWKCPTVQEVLSLIDETNLTLSIDSFPLQRPLEPSSSSRTAVCEDPSSVYDPSFLIPLYASLLQSDLKIPILPFVRSGHLSYIITATSSLCEDMRKASLYCLSSFKQRLSSAHNFLGKHQLNIFMCLLQNSIEKNDVRLPAVISSLFAKAAAIFINTNDASFNVITENMIAKPYIDIRRVPLYDVMIQSPRLQDRHWVLYLLLDGLKVDDDYIVYQRHNIVPHLMALYLSPLIDDKSKKLIMEFLIKLCNNPAASQDLTWNFNLLPWMHNMGVSDSSINDVIVNLHRNVTSNNSHKPPPYLEEDIALTSIYINQKSH